MGCQTGFLIVILNIHICILEDGSLHNDDFSSMERKTSASDRQFLVTGVTACPDTLMTYLESSNIP